MLCDHDGKQYHGLSHLHPVFTRRVLYVWYGVVARLDYRDKQIYCVLSWRNHFPNSLRLNCDFLPITSSARICVRSVVTQNMESISRVSSLIETGQQQWIRPGCNTLTRSKQHVTSPWKLLKPSALPDFPGLLPKVFLSSS